MLKQFAILLAAVGLAHGAMLDFDFTASPQTINDGNPTGWSSSGTVNIPGAATIQSVTVTLNISGGWSGDLYGYIAHGSDTVVLLNRVGTGTAGDILGTGYSDPGLQVTFMDSGANIHSYQSASPQYNGNGQLTGTWAPDSAKSLATAFNGKNANGNWTLFLADLCASSEAPSQVLGWSLQVQAVPEPIHVALGIFGGLFGVAGLWRSKWLRKATQAKAQPR